MKQLVVGASGLLGGFIYRSLIHEGLDQIIGSYYGLAQPDMIPLAMEDQAAVDAVFAAVKPQIVYLVAAQPNVDWCEREPAAAYRINVGGTENVLRACARNKARVVFFSSDYVFRGDAPPYYEDDVPDPINVYGQHKVLCEQLVLSLCPGGLVVRTTGIYGSEARRKNFVYRVLDTIGRGEIVAVPHDQLGSPSYAPDIAQVVQQLLSMGASGIYHVVGPEMMDRYSFAMLIARVFGLPSQQIVALDTATLAQTAPRPLAPVLDGTKVRAACAFEFHTPAAGLKAMARLTGQLGA
ncbi:MAG: SDR family oxidoreductase [Herpetosiphonaceae bacterium]|nr:SDR family oxidoreductase [Herpetosiphonaceae bacterium]